MFNDQILKELPVKKFKKQHNKESYQLFNKVMGENQSVEYLNQEDILSLKQHIVKIKRPKTSFFKSLCFVKLLCSQDKELRLKEKSNEIFEKHLDICSFVKSQATL